MTVAAHITALLTGLTPDQLRALSRAERQRLSDQLERVDRMIAVAERAAAGQPEAVQPVARAGEHAQ